MIGAIDGTYINIRTPKHKLRSTYINRHDGISMTLQGICDADKMFIDAFIGNTVRQYKNTCYNLMLIIF